MRIPLSTIFDRYDVYLVCVNVAEESFVLT